MKAAYVFGFLALLPIALVSVFAVLAAAAQEVDNRAAARLRQSWQIDKAHILKIPEIHRRTRARDCQLSDADIRCLVYKNGEQKIAVAE